MYHKLGGYEERVATHEIQKKVYDSINATFKDKVIFHVGIDAGCYSELDGMLECMLYCYYKNIKFVLYSDDANFSGGHGMGEFFLPFCEENHHPYNTKANTRYKISKKHILKIIKRIYLKLRYNSKYLTNDVFGPFILTNMQRRLHVTWSEFNIDGIVHDVFGELGNLALCYNRKTWDEIMNVVNSLSLPDDYISIQFRGGDKTLEFDKLMDVDETIKRIEDNNIQVNNLFVFTDDYNYVSELSKKRPEWNLYTLTKENEHGYVNADFNKLPWETKRKDIIKLFAIVEICINSKLHLGCEQTCVNSYIKSVKNNDSYMCIMEE